MEILGHKKNLINIRTQVHALEGGKSYLLSGPQAIGKFLVALELAKEVVGEPLFQSTEEVLYPIDVIVLEPLIQEVNGKKKENGIPVESVREAIQFLSRYPSKGTHRVLIIREAQTLSTAAQNMILKTLEEPAESALIFLITHAPDALLPTVRSRVEEKYFLPLKEEELKKVYTDELLESKNIPIFFRSFGRPGLLQEAICDSEAFAHKKKYLTSLYTLSRLSARERLDLAESLSANKKECIDLLEWWVLGLRSQAQKQNKVKSSLQLYQFIDNVLETITFLKTTQGNARMLVEQLFFQIR